MGCTFRFVTGSGAGTATLGVAVGRRWSSEANRSSAFLAAHARTAWASLFEERDERRESRARMLILLKAGTTESTVTDVMSRLRMLGLSVHRTDHDRRVRLAAMGDGTPVDFEALKHWPGVESVEKIAVPFKLVSRTFHPADTVISV